MHKFMRKLTHREKNGQDVVEFANRFHSDKWAGAHPHGKLTGTTTTTVAMHLTKSHNVLAGKP